jgi:CubicO group peptidase (beta-lactamase class C family)
MKRFQYGLLVIFYLFASATVEGQNKPIPSPSGSFEQYETLIKETMQKSHLVGVGAALILGDSVVWKEGFGYADKENKIPFTTQSTLRVGSVTKPFTALGIMQLQEKGLLDIDEPLVKYLPQFSIKTRGTDLKEITVRSVMTHTSGLPNDIFYKAWDATEKYTDTLHYVKREYLAFPPNTIFHYSNIGICLLGHAIYEVSKQDYPAYMKKNVLIPIGMNNSGFIGYDKLGHVSKTYDTDGTIVTPPNIRNIPSGTLSSNIDDLVRFAQELIAIYHGKRGGIVQPETLKRIFSEQADTAMINNRREVLGWSLLKNDSEFAVLHFGSDNVSSAGLIIVPGKKMASIFLANTAGGSELAEDFCHNILEYCGLSSNDYFIVHEGRPEKSGENIFSAGALKKHIGIYAHTRSFIEVTPNNNELRLKTASSTYFLKPVSEDEFIPSKVLGPDKYEQMPKARFLFKDVPGYHGLIWQDEAGRREALGYRISPQNIDETWINRFGQYRLVGYNTGGKETFAQAELLVSDNRMLQLKLFYTSGEYLYNLRIENDNELVFCGFDEIVGGDTIQFYKEKQNEVMVIYGLTLKKIDQPFN